VAAPLVDLCPRPRLRHVVLDLYQRQFAGQALADDEYVVSADEKTSIQARCRCHPTLPPGAARAMRIEHEYDRGGALAYLAAGTSTRPSCSAAARLPPASPRSAGWSPRS
jgi:hypothetical protein